MKKKVPEIRFPEFSGDWEEKKLGEIGEIITGTTPPIKNESYYLDGGVIWITPTDINENISFDSARKLSLEGVKVSKVVPKNSILVTCIASIGKNTILGVEGSFNQQINALVPNIEKYYPYFLYINSHFWSKSILKLCGSVGMTMINKRDFSNIRTLTPNLPEQQKIGNFFKRLDDSITLQNKKIENLKLQKKGLLQKMFPKNGEAVPEVRFPEFSGDWEDKKLGEVVERITRKNIDLKSDLPLTISAEHGLVDQITFFNKKIASKDISGYYLLNNGEFAYNKSYSKNYPWGVVKRLEKYDSGVLSTLYILFKPVKINSDFLVVYYETNSWHKEVAVRASEGARNHGLLNITAKDFFETKLLVPETKLEQQKIGNFFKKLDTLILLNQQKLENLEKRKKGLLQKMFV